jgi:hypothetical protein
LQLTTAAAAAAAVGEDKQQDVLAVPQQRLHMQASVEQTASSSRSLNCLWFHVSRMNAAQNPL